MNTFSILNASKSCGWAIVRPTPGNPTATQARDDDGSWAPLATRHVKPLPPGGSGLTRHVRTIALPDDVGDGDCLIIFDTINAADGPVPIEVYNLLTPMPAEPTVHIDITTDRGR